MAAPEFRVHVGGLRELRADLRSVSRDLPARVIPVAGRKAADLVLPVAVREAPSRTGRLRGTHRVVASQRRAAVRAGGGRAFYAPMVLFGTGMRYQRSRSNKSVGRVAANPWLFRALGLVGEHRIVGVYETEMLNLMRRFRLA